MAMTEQQVQLVTAAQGGDMASFEQLYAIYHNKVYGYARMLLRNDGDAEDALQETFVTAWQKLATLQAPPTFSVWIQVIARNLCNMQLRKKNMAVLLDAEQDLADFDTYESDELLPAVYAERADLRERLSKIIDSLSDVQRQAIVLYYFNELSIDEIAEIMECSPGTVKSRLYLARKAIKAEVEEQERKSGQKFYGAAMLPLGGLIRAHVEALAINDAAAGTVLSAIAETISNAEAANMAAAQLGHIGTGGKGAGLVAKMSLGAKVAAGITVVAALGATVVLVLLLTRGGFGSPAPTGGDSTPKSSATASSSASHNEAAPSLSNNEPGSAQGTTQDTTQDPAQGTAQITTQNRESSAPNQQRGPAYDRNDLASAVADLPRDEALRFIFARLDGYWNATGEMFIGFFEDGGTLRFEYGLHRSSYWFGGEVIDAYSTGSGQLALVVHLPARPAGVLGGEARPERTETIFLNVNGLPQDGKINAKVENLRDGGWYTFAYGGKTLEAALNNR